MVAAAAQTSSRYVDSAEPVAGSPSRIRRGLRSALADWDMPSEVAENALLVVEELVANAVDHARTPFRLTVDRVGPALRIAVRDGCSRPVHLRPTNPHAARGRGLQMIAALTSGWGCHRTPAGKTVWAVLPA